MSDRMNQEFENAWHTLLDAIGEAQGTTSPGIMELEGLTVDQRLKVAEISALLSISNELSRLKVSKLQAR
ncbi:MAG: hypothetical protein FWD75_10890 [Propionibacteriaceae bacterium]|nr:hypothetical protein [Propionibacteriaceae bacterium]